MPLPRNLEEASSSISKLKEEDPDVLQGFTLDLEVLLGNKKAVPKPVAAEASELSQKAQSASSKSAVSAAAEGSADAGVGETKTESPIGKSMEEGEEEEVPVPYDADRDGPPRFGGGGTGKPHSGHYHHHPPGRNYYCWGDE